MERLDDGRELLVTVVRIVREEEIRYPAAALAYYAFVSFVPLLTLVIALLGDRISAEVQRTAPQFVTPQVQQLIERSLVTASSRVVAGLLAVLVLVWSSLNLVGGIRAVFERIEGEREDSLLLRVRDVTAVLWSLGAAILTIVVTSIVFELTPDTPFLASLGFVILWIALAAVFLPLYLVPSTVVASPLGAHPGAVTASLGWTVIHSGVLFYAGNAGRYAIYGVLSGVIIILTSLYLAAAVLLTGIIINVVVANESGL
jgi:membrane protein